MFSLQHQVGFIVVIVVQEDPRPSVALCFFKTYVELTTSPPPPPSFSPQACLWGWGVDQCEGSCSISKDTRGFSLVSDLNHSGGLPNGWKLDLPNSPLKYKSTYTCAQTRRSQAPGIQGKGFLFSCSYTPFCHHYLTEIFLTNWTTIGSSRGTVSCS
jgi:hypothetical protein